jgi:hypothetical protein
MRPRLSGLRMVINRPLCDEESQQAKLRGRAKLRLSRGRRTNHGSDGASPRPTRSLVHAGSVGLADHGAHFELTAAMNDP